MQSNENKLIEELGQMTDVLKKQHSRKQQINLYQKSRVMDEDTTLHHEESVTPKSKYRRRQSNIKVHDDIMIKESPAYSEKDHSDFTPNHQTTKMLPVENRWNYSFWRKTNSAWAPWVCLWVVLDFERRPDHFFSVVNCAAVYKVHRDWVNDNCYNLVV